MNQIYPTITQYISALEAAEDNLKTRGRLRLMKKKDGTPEMTSGNFAVVFKMQDNVSKEFFAMKCFIKEQNRRGECYRMIAEELSKAHSSYITHLEYLEDELFVDVNGGTEFSVLLMDWVDGETLDVYLRRAVRNQDNYELQLLSYKFNQMVLWLLEQPFAHGDLKHDNILVDKGGNLKLVDYDGMFVPAMKGEQAREIGSPDYRHPNRTNTDFDGHIDDFTLVMLSLTLKALSCDKTLLKRYGAADRLLFSQKDYQNPEKSALLKELLSISLDCDFSLLYGTFLIVLRYGSFSYNDFHCFYSIYPNQPEIVIYSTEVTEEEKTQGIKDEYGVLYSEDGKRLLNGSNIPEYRIRSGTKVICNYAFSQCRSLSSIEIPGSVTQIGESAFFGCSSLTSILVSANNPIFCSIGDVLYDKKKSSLIRCSTKYIQFEIPESVTQIGDSAFSECSSLTSIEIPDSVTQIGDSAFYRCSSLTNIEIPGSVTRIGISAFSGCSSLTSIEIPDSVTQIEAWAFDECSSLTSIFLSKKLYSRLEEDLNDSFIVESLKEENNRIVLTVHFKREYD